jgi:hypothetical protein
MGSGASKEDDERHQNKELEKGKDHPDNKKLEANKEFKVRLRYIEIRHRTVVSHAFRVLP